MKTLLEIVNRSADFLKDKKVANPRREAQYLICDALGIDLVKLYMEHDRPLSEPEIDMLRKRVVRRAQGEPNPYIHGEIRFGGCMFLVNRDVLIPRQETEILVEMVAKELEKVDFVGETLWDVCCGSGCIGISLKKRFPALHVVLADVSDKALAVAKSNVEKNGVQVEIAKGDLLTPFRGKRTRFFVCNPPYVAEQDFAKLDWEVQGFEPRQALVAGPTGIEFYQRLAKELPDYLFPGARAWFELGSGQGEAVKSLFQTSPWKWARVEADWAGHDRFFFLEIE